MYVDIAGFLIGLDLFHDDKACGCQNYFLNQFVYCVCSYASLGQSDPALFPGLYGSTKKSLESRIIFF